MVVARERVSVSVGSRSVGSRFGRVPSRHSDGTPRHTYVDRYESVRGCLSPSHAIRNHGTREVTHIHESIEISVSVGPVVSTFRVEAGVGGWDQNKDAARCVA